MNDLQQELDANPIGVDIQIIGINERGHEVGNDVVTDGRDLPWLQDVDADENGVSDVWYDRWDIVYRDVMVVDADNVHVASYNLTTFDLADQQNYDDLKALLISAAESSQTTTWHNTDDPLDVDANSIVVPLDALHIFNELNAVGSYELPSAGASVDYYYDTNNDGFITPLDALLVLNHLNTTSQVAEGEADGNVAAARAATDLVTRGDDVSSLHSSAIDNLMSDDLPAQAIDLDLTLMESEDEPDFDIDGDDEAERLQLLPLGSV